MPYADPEVKKQKDREYKARPEVKARNNELYRKRYAKDQGGIRTTKRNDHHERWQDPEYREKKYNQYLRRAKRDWAANKIIQLRAKAKRDGKEFNLEKGDLVLPTHCPVFGFPLVNHIGDRKQYNDSPSVDRIDNNKGYIKGNVVVVSLKANSMKRAASLDDLRKLVKFYEQFEDYQE